MGVTPAVPTISSQKDAAMSLFEDMVAAVVTPTLEREEDTSVGVNKLTHQLEVDVAVVCLRLRGSRSRHAHRTRI